MYDLARRQFEKQYDSLMTIKELQASDDDIFSDGEEWTAVVSDEPCRVSKKQQLLATDKGDTPNIGYYIALYCKPDVKVRPGSKILITNTHGETREYARTGEAFNSYKTHQEISIARSDTA